MRFVWQAQIPGIKSIRLVKHAIIPPTHRKFRSEKAELYGLLWVLPRQLTTHKLMVVGGVVYFSKRKVYYQQFFSRIVK
jgi:hypothetical protein